MSGNRSATGTGMWLADNFKLVNNSVPALLNAVNLAHKVFFPFCSVGVGAPRRFGPPRQLRPAQLPWARAVNAPCPA
jgi:hypothetical protein